MFQSAVDFNESRNHYSHLRFTGESFSCYTRRDKMGTFRNKNITLPPYYSYTLPFDMRKFKMKESTGSVFRRRQIEIQI